MSDHDSNLYRAAQISKLQEMLDEIPEEDIIDRLTVKARMKALAQEMNMSISHENIKISIK